MAKTLDAREDFLTLSEALTGFSAVELQGTGLVDSYYNTVQDILGERIFGRLLLTWHEIFVKYPGDPNVLACALEERILSHGHGLGRFLGPVARNIILLWYEGTWHQMPREWRNDHGASARDLTHVVSVEAYQEGLMWRAIGAHTRAAKAPGFGSWTAPPEGAEDIDDDWKAGLTATSAIGRS